MVSLVSRSDYFREFDSNPYIQGLVRFLYGQALDAGGNPNLANANDLSLVVLQAIQENDIIQFNKAYDYISYRKPRSDSDWVYNDMLLFSLTVGVLKFHVSPNWLLDVLGVRQEIANTEKKLISQTLTDMLYGNFSNPNSYLPLVLVIQYLLEIPFHDLEQVNLVYSTLVQQDFPAHETVFLNAVFLRAIDVIVLSKGLLDWENYYKTLEFTRTFKSRVRRLSNIFTYIVIIAVATGTAWAAYTWFWPFQSEQADLLDRVLNIVTGIGLVPPITLVFMWKDRIIRIFEIVLMWLWGYRELP